MVPIAQLPNAIASRIKLVFFDIDGTLLSSKGQYTETLKQQILRLRQQGIKTAIASGRPSYAAQFLFDQLSISDTGLFCTGAEIYQPSNDNHLQLHLLDNALVKSIYQRAKVLGFYCELYTPDNYYVETQLNGEEQKLSELHSQHLRVKPVVAPYAPLFGSSARWTKLLLGRSTELSDYSLQQLAYEFPQVEFAFAHFLPCPQWEFASVISSQANKTTAFEQLLNKYQLPAEAVMAIGDSQSDQVFIELSGVGVAMGNASCELKARADYVTATADNDGVAKALAMLP